MVGFGLDERNGLTGNLSKYCGRPGKKQMNNSNRRAMV